MDPRDFVDTTIPPLERAAARRRAHEVAPPHYSSTTRMVRRLI